VNHRTDYSLVFSSSEPYHLEPSPYNCFYKHGCYCGLAARLNAWCFRCLTLGLLPSTPTIASSQDAIFGSVITSSTFLTFSNFGLPLAPGQRAKPKRLRRKHDDEIKAGLVNIARLVLKGTIALVTIDDHVADDQAWDGAGVEHVESPLPIAKGVL
jgi:hypothetical protein